MRVDRLSGAGISFSLALLAGSTQPSAQAQPVTTFTEAGVVSSLRQLILGGPEALERFSIEPDSGAQLVFNRDAKGVIGSFSLTMSDEYCVRMNDVAVATYAMEGWIHSEGLSFESPFVSGGFRGDAAGCLRGLVVNRRKLIPSLQSLQMAASPPLEFALGSLLELAHRGDREGYADLAAMLAGDGTPIRIIGPRQFADGYHSAWATVAGQDGQLLAIDLVLRAQPCFPMQRAIDLFEPKIGPHPPLSIRHASTHDTTVSIWDGAEDPACLGRIAIAWNPARPAQPVGRR